MAKRQVIDQVANMPAGDVRIIEVGGRSVGVINDNGRFYALRNACPHHGAPLCRGSVGGLMKPSNPHVYEYSGADEGFRVIRCPWHGYEFRLTDGHLVTDEGGLRVKTYDVRVEGDDVVLYA